MESPEIHIRQARKEDLPAIVHMLADDALGAKRESVTDPLPEEYIRAFEAIDVDPNQELIVVENDDGVAIGSMQLSFLPGISHRGAWRVQIEGVRVAAGFRSGGIGRRMILWAIERARERGCRMVQLTSNKSRLDAIRFYQKLGFVVSHEGLKLDL
ncbi:GNAT family N-acetyltransferase [bacterium]|nr:GNAT family N-acetyltransferase [bacterium]